MGKKSVKETEIPHRGSKVVANTTNKSKPTSKVSDELRQAVKDLGGDDEDLELMEGIDEDEEDSTPLTGAKGKGKAPDEVSVIVLLLFNRRVIELSGV